MYELAPNEFLFVFYAKLSQKLKRILELTEQKSKTTKEVTELFESKDKMVTAIDMLSMESNDVKLKASYSTLATLIVSTNPKDISSAIDFCTDTRI